MKRKKIIYHFAFWAALYLLWIVIFRSYAVAVTKTMTIEFCYLLFITVDYYAINNFIIPQLLFKKKYIAFPTAIIVLVIVSGWLRALVALQMNQHYFHPVATIDFSTVFFNSVFNICFWILLITIGKMIFDHVQTQQQLESLERERIKNELDYLKAQINPHALFNSLNTVYGQIDKNNQVARDTLLQFSELLRYQLYDCNAEKIALEKELAYIKNYIAFHRLRKDDQLRVGFDVSGIEDNLTIAPLLLIVLIENAFKFVSNFSGKENRIGITITTADKKLKAVITNTKEAQDNSSNSNTGGIGISNLKRRLALLYPGKHEFIINSNAADYITQLNIDLS